MTPDSVRPNTLIAAALYHAVFSAYAIFVLARELRWLHSSWSDALFPIVVCLTAAALPAVLALGLWAMDNAARYAALAFTGLHAISTILWMDHSGRVIWPAIRLALDVAVALLLLAPPSRRACAAPMQRLFYNSM